MTALPPLEQWPCDPVLGFEMRIEGLVLQIYQWSEWPERPWKWTICSSMAYRLAHPDEPHQERVYASGSAATKEMADRRLRLVFASVVEPIP